MVFGTVPPAFPRLTRLLASLQAPPVTVLVFDGDSISVGLGAAPGSTLAEQVVPLLPQGVTSHVVGAGGRPVKDCLARFDAGVRPLFDARAANNLIFFHAGDNDVTQGSSGQQTYAALEAYIARAHAQGWKVVVSTEMQRYDLPEAMRADIDTFNAAVLANGAGADGVADFEGDGTMGGVAYRRDRRYYTLDGIHPADAGYAILAGLAAKALLPCLAAR